MTNVYIVVYMVVKESFWDVTDYHLKNVEYQKTQNEISRSASISMYHCSSECH